MPFAFSVSNESQLLKEIICSPGKKFYPLIGDSFKRDFLFREIYRKS